MLANLVLQASGFVLRLTSYGQSTPPSLPRLLPHLLRALQFSGIFGFALEAAALFLKAHFSTIDLKDSGESVGLLFSKFHTNSRRSFDFFLISMSR